MKQVTLFFILVVSIFMLHCPASMNQQDVIEDKPFDKPENVVFTINGVKKTSQDTCGSSHVINADQSVKKTFVASTVQNSNEYTNFGQVVVGFADENRTTGSNIVADVYYYDPVSAKSYDNTTDGRLNITHYGSWPTTETFDNTDAMVMEGQVSGSITLKYNNSPTDTMVISDISFRCVLPTPSRITQM